MITEEGQEKVLTTVVSSPKRHAPHVHGGAVKGKFGKLQYEVFPENAIAMGS